jgi:tRNA(Ile)-lysidine synthase
MLYEYMEYSNEKQKPHAKPPQSLAPEMNDLQKRIKIVITSASLLQKDMPVIIGVSGGVDSISLLHILSFLFPATRRIAVYVDHGLRPDETESEKKLVQEQAKICSAQFKTIAVDVQGEQRTNSCSLEEAARNLRYQALETIRIACKASAIAVGHTADDQAEEVLLRLIRGSGSTGLSGMNLQYGYIIRPLLHERKKTLVSYAREQDLAYCQDSSNLDTRFLRNKIRLDLLPKLESDYNKSVRQALLQTAAILAAEDTLLAELTQNAFQRLVHREPKRILLSLPDFFQEPLAIKRRILERICWTLDSKPSFKKIESLIKITASKNRKELHLTDGLRAVREDKTLLFHRPSSQKGYRGPGIIKKTFSSITLPNPGEYPVLELQQKLLITKLPFSPELLEIPDIQIIDAETIRFPLLLRHAKAGERFHPLGAPGKKKIARFFSDHKISIMDRDNYPLVISDGKIAAIAGLRVDHGFRITDTTRHVLVLQWQTIQ